MIIIHIILLLLLLLLIIIIISPGLPGLPGAQDSSKGGAVETGWRGLHDIIGCSIV